MRAAFIILLVATVFGTAGARAHAARAEFAPNVSVTISDDAPGSHPDITTTIDASTGAMLSQVQVLTPAGGGVAGDADISDNVVVGWISGFTTIPAADGSCSQRYTFEVPLVKQTADTGAFPTFLRQLAPGSHRIRFAADVTGTPVNVIVDDVQVAGEARLRTTTYIGDPAHLAPNCAPYRSRVILDGIAGMVPITTAPPTPGPRVYDFTLTSREGDVIEQSVTATVQPGLQPRIEGANVVWGAVAGAASYKTGGDIIFTTTCELIRRLVIREVDRPLNVQVGRDVTSVPLPPSPGPDYEVAQTIIDVMAYDAEGVLLARAPLRYTRDFASCCCAPGTEPLLSVEPAAGACNGSVTFRGSRFPSGVTVEIDLAHYGTDGGGVPVATAPVTVDGTFGVTAALPSSACGIAAGYPGGRVAFFAYNADQPKGLTVFAGAYYTASVPPGPATMTAPNTGGGPVGVRRGAAWWLAAAGVVCLAAGVAVKGRHER